MTALVISVVMTMPAADPAPKFTPEAMKELKKLEGKWRAVKFVGSEGEEKKDVELFLVIEGVKATTLFGDRNKKTSTITLLDPSTDPKCLDLEEQANGRSVLNECVYKIDGDTLLIATTIPNKDKLRPVGFDKPTDPRILVITLNRVKE